MNKLSSLLRTLLLVSFAAVSMAPMAALAEMPGESDRENIQLMIRNQIAAFREDDGEAAFSHASPAIQELFSNPNRFMAMVRQGYPAVYRAQSVTFGTLIDGGEILLQQVYLVGPSGRNWIAAYLIEQQDDGSWRINGVQLTPDCGSVI